MQNVVVKHAKCGGEVKVERWHSIFGGWCYRCFCFIDTRPIDALIVLNTPNIGETVNALR